jgi:Resolvase, N terminal domain
MARRSEGQQGADQLRLASEAIAVSKSPLQGFRELSRTLLQFIRAGDVLTITRIDPLARSMAELQDIVRTLKTMGANLRRPIYAPQLSNRAARSSRDRRIGTDPDPPPCVTVHTTARTKSGMVAAAISGRLTAGRENAGKEPYGFVRRVALGKPLPGLRQATGESRILTCTAQIEGAAAGRLILDPPRVAGAPRA